MTTFAPATASDPLLGFRFAVTFATSPTASALVVGAGVRPLRAGFSEVSGLGGRIEMLPYNEGGRNDRVLKFATRVDYGNLTLRRGVTRGGELFEWFDAVRRGSFGLRRSLLIAHLDERGDAAHTWFVFRALPTAYVGPTWDAAQNVVAIESIELAHEGIELAAGR